MTLTARTVLNAMWDKPSWGLRICQETRLGSGTVYPLLQRLEKAGWIKGSWEDDPPDNRPRRRSYELTGLGRSEVLAWRQRMSPGRAAWIVAPVQFGPAE